MAETWVINESPTLGMDIYLTGNDFYSNGEHFGTITNDAPVGTDPAPDSLYYGYFGRPSGITAISLGSWTNQAYRTVTFETAPTGDLLTWLEANAVKQEPLVTDDLTGWTWVGNETPDTTGLAMYFLLFFTSNKYTIGGSNEYGEFDVTFASISYINSDLSDDINVYISAEGGWVDGADTIHITGGTDATNTDLIKWLQDNGTLTPPQTNITLDLSTIGLPAGTHSIQIKLSDDGVTKADSELSNAVEYVVGELGSKFITSDNKIFKTSDNKTFLVKEE